MKLFVYDKTKFNEFSILDKLKIEAEIELANRENNENDKSIVIECESFPPLGKFFEVGKGLRDKTEKEKVEVGEIELATIKERICNKIDEICSNLIVSGFKSDALGEKRIYQSDERDQLNLIGTVASGIGGRFKCKQLAIPIIEGEEPVIPKWEFILHTNTQIKQVLEDGKNRKEFLLEHCFKQKSAIQALNNYDAVISFDILQGWE